MFALTLLVCLGSHYASTIWMALSSWRFDLHPCLISRHNLVQEILPFLVVALQKFQGCAHFLRLVVISEHFRYPLCTAVAKLHAYNVIENWSWNLRKVGRQLRNCESTPFMNHLIPLINFVFCRYRLPTLTTPIMDISLSFFKLSAPFLHTAIVHKIFAVNITHPMMNFSCIMPFGEKKENNGPQFTLGRRFNYIREVTCLLLNNDWLEEVDLLVCVRGGIHCACAAYLYSGIARGPHLVACWRLKKISLVHSLLLWFCFLGKWKIFTINCTHIWFRY